ncbi:MAG: carboxypeptidase-like regulatory domain-containing protein, partial [Muribaculaceae bacterium]|nr:carboxypeptidase-like regulatory domain-containing protein [Muribaculaceae bacterium]
MKLKLYVIALMSLCCVLNALGAKVTGLVLDEQNQPLPGASVQVKGSKIGTVTDIEGTFTIEGETGQTLLVSYVGFVPSETKIPASKNLTIV